MQTSSDAFESTATYSSSGLKARAFEAGNVQGVVVQIIAKTFFPLSTGSKPAGSSFNAYFTHTAGVVSFSYSTSASASAVRSCQHQYTGRSPLYTKPCSKNL